MTNNTPQDSRIIALTLDEQSVTARTPEIENEMRVAIADILHENHFFPRCLPGGPYALMLGKEEQRLLFHITPEGWEEAHLFTVPTQPLRSLIRDYFLLCESYMEAIRTHDTRKIEAVDMGRRGMHNEGSEIVTDMLSGRIDVDFGTARRLFTLISILHMKGV